MPLLCAIFPYLNVRCSHFGHEPTYEQASQSTALVRTASLFVAVVVTLGDSIAAQDTQSTGVTQVLSVHCGRTIARTVALIAQVRTVKQAVTTTSHIQTRTTAARKLSSATSCTRSRQTSSQLHYNAKRLNGVYSSSSQSYLPYWITALTPAKKAGTRLCSPEEWKAELTWVIPKGFTCPQTVTHASSNHLIARRPGIKPTTG